MSLLCSKAVDMEQGSKCTNTSLTDFWAPIHPSSSSLSPDGFTEGLGHPGHVASSHRTRTHSCLKLESPFHLAAGSPLDNSPSPPYACLESILILRPIILSLCCMSVRSTTTPSAAVQPQTCQMENNLYSNILYVQQPCMGAGWTKWCARKNMWAWIICSRTLQ